MARLREELRSNWNPTYVLQEWLVERLALAFWRLERADRLREEAAVLQAKQFIRRYHDHWKARMRRLKLGREALESLAASVARPHYAAGSEDLARMQRLLDARLLAQRTGEALLALFRQLQEPHMENALASGTACHVSAQAAEPTRTVSARWPETSGEPQPVASTPDNQAAGGGRCPAATGTDGEARERTRQLLEKVLRREVRKRAALLNAAERRRRQGPSPYERAAELSAIAPRLVELQRLKEWGIQQLLRSTNRLVDLKRQERQLATRAEWIVRPPAAKKKHFGISYDVAENR